MLRLNLFPEKWRVIPSYENYAVSNLGRIMRLVNAGNTYAGKILKVAVNKKYGYRMADLYMNGKRSLCKVGKLVALAFLGPCPSGKEVNHKNGIKTEDKPENLEYITHSENIQHAYDLGLISKVRPKRKKIKQ